MTEVKEQLEQGVIPDNGFTAEEVNVMNALVEAWENYSRLESTFPFDAGEFLEGIHRCQQVLSMRILRRDYPSAFPTVTTPKQPVVEEIIE